MRLSGKTILLGVTGSIAAYKALELCRQLKKQGASIQVILSDGAKNFVQPLSFQSISGNAVLENQFENNQQGKPRKAKEKNVETTGMKHIGLSTADALIVAPATANFVAKAAVGLADDLLATTLQAFGGPVLIAPAMNDAMYARQVQHRNIRRLKELGYAVIEPDTGDLACGRVGQGRLASAEKIVARLETLLRPQDLKGKTILVSAGPTREYLDPIRFISNASSGKTGYAIAEAAKSRGANVILVSGPTALQAPFGVKTIHVQTTAQMEAAVKKQFKKADAFISAAAPADFAALRKSKTKIPKNKIKTLALQPTADILAWAGKNKKTGQIALGFALETAPTAYKARQKLKSKNADAIVLNGPDNIGGETAGGTVVFKRGQKRMAKTDKRSFAHALLDAMLDKTRRIK